MPKTPTSASGSSWFRGRRPTVVALAMVVVGVLAAILVARGCASPRSVHPDLGPGPVRGVRLTEFAPGEGEQTCAGVTADLAVVRLVAQVDVESLTVCLGPGRRADTLPLEPFVLDNTTEDGERLLDSWAAAWSLPGQSPPRWSDPDDLACPAAFALVPASAITLSGVAVRPVPPTDGCQPLPEALVALDDVSRAARPA